MNLRHSVLFSITMLSLFAAGQTFAADKTDKVDRKVAAAAGEDAAAKPSEEVGISISQLQKDLEKNEKSLEITKQKKKEVKGEAFLPDLYFVLSDLYNEKARLQYLLTRAKSPKTPMNELDFSDSKQSKKLSLESLQTFIDNFPKNPDLDKAYFNMAQTYRELGLDEDGFTDAGLFIAEDSVFNTGEFIFGKDSAGFENFAVCNGLIVRTSNPGATPKTILRMRRAPTTDIRVR